MKSGQRIVGAGMGVTLVKLTGQAADGEHYAFSMPMGAGDYLVGFEISDLTIDATLPALSNCVVGGILVRGKHVFIQRVRVQNYGSTNPLKAARGICGAFADTGTPPYDTVIADCLIDPPSANHTQIAHALSLDGTPTSGVMNYHDFSVIRGCLVDGGFDPESASNPTVYGSFVLGARGTIIENNQFRNCLIGGAVHTGTVAAEIRDLIIRENFYENCELSIQFSVMPSDPQPFVVERVIIENNLIDMPAPNGIPATYLAGIGISLILSNSTNDESVYKTAIFRNNRLRGRNGWPVWTGSIGMQLCYVQSLTVENNIVDMKVGEANNFIQQWDCGTVQAFNNRRSTGELIELVDPNTNLHVPELTTEAENVLLGL